MKIRTEETARPVVENVSMESKVKSMGIQMALMSLFLVLYLNKGGFILGLIFGYFCINSCFILLLILLASSSKEKKKPVSVSQRKLSEEKTEKRKTQPEVKTEKKTEINFQLSFRKKKKSIAPPKQITIKRLEEFREEFHLTRQVENEFRNWVVNSVLGPFLSEQETGRTSFRSRKILSMEEIKIVRMIRGNRMICYDKNNEAHSRALFKVLYNYFNEKIPGDSSFYTNPMDEFVFDDISKVKISRYGLLVEDTESLVEGRKTFNVYFMHKNVLYDTLGDVLLSFLVLLVFANKNDGECLGALYLRSMPFLSR